MNGLEESNSNIFHNKLIVGLVVIVTFILFLIAFVPGTGDWIQNEYLITAAAIIPLLYTTVAQHIELGYQRKELKDSTSALQGQHLELTETKEINDKHQINNQFFQLLSMRENFTHSTNSGDQTKKERLYSVVGIYGEVTKTFREIVVYDYMEVLEDSEKLELYSKYKRNGISYGSDSQRIEEVTKTIPRLVSYYDYWKDDFEWPQGQKVGDVETLREFIKGLTIFVNEESNKEKYTKKLKSIIMQKESEKRVLSKHFSYHKTIVRFLNNINYTELKSTLTIMYLDLLIQGERFYFGIKLMNEPLSLYIFRPSNSKEVNNSLYRENIMNLTDIS